MAGAGASGGWPPSNYASVPAPGGGGYGGLRPPGFMQGKAFATMSLTEDVILVAVPSIVSAVVFCLFANVYHRRPLVVFSIIAIFLIVAALAQSRFRTVPLAKYLGSIVCCATLLSTLIGAASWTAAFQHFWFLHESNSYSNVLVTEPAGGYADAGKLVFADGTRVDAGRALGYKDGRTYCVAPIVDEMMSGPVEFWAVGKDCCSVRGSFWCDDAWNPKARSGIVVRDSDPDLAAEFAPAVRQAEAAFEIAAAAKPMLVRWVVDPEQVQLNYRVVGVAVLFSAWLVLTLLFALAVMGLNTTMNGWRSLFR